MIALGIILFLLSLSAHEIGHAFAMRRNNVKIAKISLLGFGPTIATFKLRKWFGDVPVYIKLIPLGAFVAPQDENYNLSLSYNQKVQIAGSGVIANILFSSLIFGIAYWAAACVSPKFEGASILIMSSLIAVGIIIGLFPKITVHLVLPIGLLLVWLIIFSVTKDHPQNASAVHQNLSSNSGSIILIIEDIKKHSDGIFNTVFFAALLSLSVGLVQSLPLYPLDGGRIASDSISLIFRKTKIPATIFKVASGLLLGYLIVTAISSDIMRIVGWIH